MVAEVLIELEHVFIDKTFSYLIPLNLIDKLQVGMRVVVPFGNRELEGFVLKILSKQEIDYDLKEICSLVDDFVVLNKELLELGKFISDTTLTSLMKSYQAMLPKALKAKIKVNMKPMYKSYVILKNQNIELSGKQNEIVQLLKKSHKIEKSILNNISISSVKTLLKKDIIEEVKEEIYRYSINDKIKSDFNLFPQQQKIYDEILNYKNSNEVFLLHGVTGSGKTNIYMKLIENILKDGKQAIVLVPEISLTPQIISRFTSMFNNIAVLHSKLSDGEKYDEWRKIKDHKVDIVIGARSAIFAPFDNIGLIVIDEEHSTTYKQESAPRYSTIEVAKFRSKYHNCPLILGSATPSLESYARAKKNVYHLLELNSRANNKEMPIVKIIDMNKEFKKSNSFLSNELKNEIIDKINKKEQIILFLNKRGYSNFVTCPECGNTYKCPNCDISLTYHKSSNMLRCHYCGYAIKKDNKCNKCHADLVDYGMGTEKVEEEIAKLIPEAKVVRMDIDTTTRKNAVDKIINDFMDEKYNILLGTQMIAKGLDFPNVTLVGVINADISLNFPDFRSSEYTFQLLNQVSGRSGRGSKAGEVLIQTYNPDHYAIVCSSNNDYICFYNEEMSIRRKLGYSPYYYLCLIRIISSNYDISRDVSNSIGNYLKQELQSEIVLGPSISNIFKINNKYHFQIIIKYKNIDNIKECINIVNERYFNNKQVKVEIDFNPVKL